MLPPSILILLLIAGCLAEGRKEPAPLPDDDRQQTIPAAPAPTLDGRIEDEEWRLALRQDLAGGGQLYLQHHGDFLYVALRGVEPGWGHVYLLDGDSLRVLHASAALGMAVYHPDKDDLWQAMRDFVWEMRDPGLTPEAQAARTAYLGRHGWVATTGRMGTPEEVEYQIDKRLVSSTPVLAVVYAATPEVPRYWPASLDDATLDPALIRGTTPDTLPFDAASWQPVAFSP